MSDQLVQVYASTDTVGAELMKARLEAEGISVMTKGEVDGPYPTGASYLWVMADDEIRARAIVDAVASGAFEVQDDDVMEAAEDVPEA